jgi:hypothetical protein
MLQDHFQPETADWPDLNEFCYQHDRASAHYSQIARDYLNEMFSDKWMACRVPVEWSSRSPDLTPPDFFAWGVVKDTVYSKKPTSVDQLETEIIKAFQQISIEICEKVCRSVKSRLYKCLEAEGGHFEHD